MHATHCSPRLFPQCLPLLAPPIHSHDSVDPLPSGQCPRRCPPVATGMIRDHPPPAPDTDDQISGLFLPTPEFHLKVVGGGWCVHKEIPTNTDLSQSPGLITYSNKVLLSNGKPVNNLASINNSLRSLAKLFIRFVSSRAPCITKVLALHEIVVVNIIGKVKNYKFQIFLGDTENWQTPNEKCKR